MDWNQFIAIKLYSKMNLNKYTKAELITQIKRTKSELNNKTDEKTIFIINYLFKVWDSFIILKNILLKLTLISFFIQLFRKYKLLRKLWLTLNTVVMSIFGISLLENFVFEFISSFIREIKFIIRNTLDYLTNTHFYSFLSNLFEKPSS